MGPILAEKPFDSESAQARNRFLLVKGRFGTGKSILGLQLAWEIASRGGLVWFLPMEQTVNDCLQTIHSFTPSYKGVAPQIVRNTRQVAALMKSESSSNGALIFLPEIKTSLEELLGFVREHAYGLGSYSLRVVIVDPINSVYQSDDAIDATKRDKLLSNLRNVLDGGSNLVVVAEEHQAKADSKLACSPAASIRYGDKAFRRI